MYLILLILGLLIGAVFLVVLLIGDKKEARLEAQKKAMQEQIAQAGQPVDGAWPPPPSASALPSFALPASSARQPGPARAANRKMVRTFFQIRNGAIGTVVLAFIIYSCFPQLAFEWVLLTTALAAGLGWGGMILLKKRQQ
jgi:Flp pilus assembly protein protease CpaA